MVFRTDATKGGMGSRRVVYDSPRGTRSTAPVDVPREFIQTPCSPPRKSRSNTTSSAGRARRLYRTRGFRHQVLWADAKRRTEVGRLALPNGSRLSCGALKKDSFLNLRAPPASSAC